MRGVYVCIGQVARLIYEWADRKLEAYYSGSVVEHIKAAKWER